MSDTLPAQTKRLVGYFPAWGMHAQNYHVADIPAGQLTHVIYAFAQLNSDGTCVSINANDDGINFPQLQQLKQQHPNVQTLISVGGASHSTTFANAASTARVHCAQSCVQFMKQNGFDGIDIDWEYPAAADSQNFTALLTELRRQLVAAGATDKRSYLLTIAAPAGADHYANLQLNLIHPQLDWLNLMAYDFTVASSTITDFVAPLKAYDPSVAKHAASNVDAAVQAYLRAGVPAAKLVMGTRFIGTGWQGVVNADNGLYKNNRGPAKGTWDAATAPPSGSFGYQDIVQNYVKSSTRFWHADAEVPWVFDPATGIMVSYEDPQSLSLKASYVVANALAGVMIWDLSADDGAHTLLNSLVDGLGQASDLATYTVTGRVTSPDSASIGRLFVQLVDKAVGSDVPLGATTTSATGQYKISVNISNATLQARFKGQPDFQVRVSVGQTFLVASEILYNASPNETLNVTLPPNIAALPSEHETLTGAIAVNYSRKVGELQENDERQDITYLANKTGWDARAVALAALADQFSQITAPAPAPAPVPAPRPAPVPAPAPAAASLKPEFYYALFRAGFPANPDGLFQASPKAVQAVWERAIKQGVIPQSLSGETAGAVQTFTTLSGSHMLGAKPPVGISSMEQMLQASLPSITPQQQQQFALLYAQHRDDMTTFWSQVETSFGAPTAKLLQLHGQLYYLTLNNAPLVSALDSAERQTPLTSTLDLATRGYYDPSKWVPLIGNSIPTEIPGKTADEQRSNYAQLLATQVRLAFPTAVVAGRVKNGTFPLLDPTKLGDVTKFLNDNQGKFEIGIEPIKAYLARTNDTTTPAPVVNEITRLQRVYQLTPDDQSIGVLLQHNLHSAYDITRYDSAGFVRAFYSKLGGKDVAAKIHARAKQIHGAVLNIATSYLIAKRAPAPGGPSPVHVPFPAPPANQSYPIIAYPTLENLFGSLDYCSCQECRSILSPAAYLVDLLHYLDQQSPTPPYQNPQSVLFQRRPDLQYLPLTCENTNTALPYVDIVNETLEYFVTNNLSLANYQGHDTGDRAISAELLANPQYVNDAAYTTLQSAFFPPPLPFNRPLDLLRLYLQKIGVALPDVMAALRPSDAVERGVAAYGWRDILMEQLGISRNEYRLFTDSTLKLQGLYGYPSLTDPEVLQKLQTMSLQDFSRRLGVDYADLFSIVKTRFINPNAVLIPRLERLNVPFSTLQTLKNDPTTAAQFKAALPAGLDAREYGGSDYDAIVKWVTDPANYARIMSIITITNPTNSGDLCSGNALQFRHANPDNTKNMLSATDFLKLIRFLRLWPKLGLSVEQTDDILAALYPPADLPTGNNDAVNFTLLDTGFLALLPRVGFLFQVMSQLSLTATSRLAPLLACWAPIDTTEPHSLYASMFLTPTLVQQDVAFADDGYGNLLANGSEKLLAHEATLCAAFNLTGAEFELITAALAFDANKILTLANVSAVYRVGWLAHTLRLSVVEFLLLRQCTGLDPFAPLDPLATAPAEPPVIRFIRLLQALRAAALQPVQALYLLWNQDVSGKSAPTAATVTGLARTLRADFAAVEAKFTLVDDPDGSLAKGLMALVYGSAATDFFFGLLNNTLVTSVAYGNAQPTLPQPILDASSGRLSYDDLRKQLTYTGVLDAATQTAIDTAITNNGNSAPLHAALASLASANHKTVDPFFATYKELLPLYLAYAASSDPPQSKRTALLANFLPSLKQKRKQEEALAAITAAAGTDPSFATALLQDPSILQAAAQSTAAAYTDLTSIELQGLSAQFFLTNNPAAPPDQTVDSVPRLSYAPATNPLPPGQGGGAIAGIWSGYIEVPHDGFYNISVVTDLGASVTLNIGGQAVTIALVGNVWSNQSPISLTAGALAPIALKVTSLRNTLTVSWESLGLGWQIIPGSYLYSATLVDRLSTTYVRFLKATALAAALSLTADETAYIGTAPSFRVNTTDGRDKTVPGNRTLTPTSMANIGNGSTLIIDSGGAQEVVTVLSTTATAFSATTTKPHDGTVAPFAIVNQAFPSVGQGWLNFLAVSQSQNATTNASLRDVLVAVLDFARMKEALSPSDERLLQVLENPLLTLTNGSSALSSLTGWSDDSRQALLKQFFGSADLTKLATIPNFRRVFDAYAVVKTCRVSAAALIAATTNDPSPAMVSAFQSALRALYAEADWLALVRPINDAMRIRQRDALVACILQRLGDQYEQSLIPVATAAPAKGGDTTLSVTSTANIRQGMQVQGTNILTYTTVTAVGTNTVTISPGLLGDLPAGSNLTFDPGTAPAINTADKLFEFFLIDVLTQPPVETSRIRVALSSVQLFIERILRNLEPQVSPNDIDGSLWPWMKRYRVWQANREVFLWPENWLYPELRDDQSPFFQETMSALLQSDITDDAAANAYLDYLTKLEGVAKLEPCGLYYVPASSDSDKISYVVARTAGAHKYYFRKLENGSWTPWEEIKLQIDDTPVAPFVWNNRLLLFWLKILKQSSLDPNNLPAPSNDVSNIGGAALSALQSAATSSARTATQVNVQAMLCWSEFYNGKWQPTKTSDQNRPTLIGTFDASGQNAFDPKKYQMQIASYSADKLVVSITLCGNNFSSVPPGFLLYNTHSTPLALEDVADNPNWGAIAWRSMSTSYPGSGGGINPNIAYPPPASPNTFSISYVKMEAIPFPHQVLAYSNDILTSPVGERVVVTQPISGIAVAWNLPFFFEDSRNMFYVTTSQALVPIHFYLGYGILPGAISLSAVAGAISGLALPHRPKPVVRFTPNVSPTNPPLADLAQMQRFVTEDAHIHASMATAASVSFQGQQIGPRGRLTGVRQTQSK